MRKEVRKKKATFIRGIPSTFKYDEKLLFLTGNIKKSDLCVKVGSSWNGGGSLGQNAIAGREIRMIELKKVIEKLHAQIESEGLTPAADDPLKMAGKDYT